MKTSGKTLAIITLILAGEAIFLLPFIVMRVFRPIIREAFLINDFEIGKAQALYGVTAMVSYAIGGYLADTWPPRRLISISLIITAFGGVYMLSLPSFFGLQLLYGFWGVSTILLFWAALIKATRLWGGSDKQGLSFGLLDGGRGAFAALIATFGALIPTLIFPENTTGLTFEAKATTIRYIIAFVTLAVVLIAGLVWLVLPDQDHKTTTSGTHAIHFTQAITLLAKPKVLCHAIIIVCAYATYKVTDVFATYAQDVWGYSVHEASNFGVMIQWLRPIAAISLGWIADKFLPSKVVIGCFMVVALATSLLGFGILTHHPIIISTLVLVTMATGIYALRGLYFALIEESKTSIATTGTLVGIISLIGYTPDIFMSLISGAILGENPTLAAYQMLFKVVILFPIIGLLATLGFRFFVKK